MWHAGHECVYNGPETLISPSSHSLGSRLFYILALGTSQTLPSNSRLLGVLTGHYSCLLVCLLFPLVLVLQCLDPFFIPAAGRGP